MKKKFREIVVNDKTYGWTVVAIKKCSFYKKKIKIWYNKQIVHTEENCPDEITPSLVKDIIERNEL